MTLDQLRGTAPCRNGLSHSSEAATGIVVHECPPRGKNLGGVLPDVNHFGKVNLVSALPEARSEEISLCFLTTTNVGSSAVSPSRMNGTIGRQEGLRA